RVAAAMANNVARMFHSILVPTMDLSPPVRLCALPPTADLNDGASTAFVRFGSRPACGGKRRLMRIRGCRPRGAGTGRGQEGAGARRAGSASHRRNCSWRHADRKRRRAESRMAASAVAVELAFLGHPFERLAGALDAILIIVAVRRQQLHHLIASVRPG